MDEKNLIGIGMEPVNRLKRWHFLPDEKPLIGAREVLRDVLIMLSIAGAAAVAVLLVWGGR